MNPQFRAARRRRSRNPEATSEVSADLVLVAAVVVPLIPVSVLVITANGSGLSAIVVALIVLLVSTAAITASIERSAGDR